MVGRSPDSRIAEFELPSQISQWLISLALSALTVAGPCRIFTSFPIAPTVVGYKAERRLESRIIGEAELVSKRPPICYTDYALPGCVTSCFANHTLWSIKGG